MFMQPQLPNYFVSVAIPKDYLFTQTFNYSGGNVVKFYLLFGLVKYLLVKQEPTEVLHTNSKV